MASPRARVHGAAGLRQNSPRGEIKGLTQPIEIVSVDWKN